MLFIQRYCSRWYITVTTKYSSFSHQYVALHHMKPFMLSRHCGHYGFQALPEQTVDLIHNVAKFIISICGRQFQLHNQPVHLVDADGDGHTLLNCMFDQTLCVQHHLGRETQKVWVIWKLGELRHMCR